MQILRSSYIGLPVMSVHSGEKLCELDEMIIRKDTLKIVVFKVQAGFSKKPLYLMPDDVRFTDKKRLIIDSVETLSEFDDLVRYQHDILHSYQPLRKRVVTESGKKLGFVEDFSFDDTQYLIKKLYVKVPLIKRILQQQLIIDRSAILETKSKLIIVKDAVVKEASKLNSPLPSKAAPKDLARTISRSSR